MDPLRGLGLYTGCVRCTYHDEGVGLGFRMFRV